MATSQTPAHYTRWNPAAAWTNTINTTRRDTATGKPRPARPLIAIGHTWLNTGSINATTVTTNTASAVLVNHRHHHLTLLVAAAMNGALLAITVIYVPAQSWIALIPTLLIGIPTIVDSARHLQRPRADLWVHSVVRHHDAPPGGGQALLVQITADHPYTNIGGDAQNEQVWQRIYQPVATRNALQQDDQIYFTLNTTKRVASGP